MLVHIPKALTPALVQSIQTALAQADWTDGSETVGAQGAKVKRNLQLPEQSPLRQQLGQHVLSALAAQPLYHAASLPARVLPPRFNRYADQGHYGNHVDGAVMTSPNGLHVRSDISCTVFLNAPDSYAGGELIIEDTYGEHEVKLDAGDAILYPSSSLHRVQAVTEGVRLAAFFWIQSLVRDDGQRRLLFEMDTSIQALNQTHADPQAILQLTGVYHNLLRRWAET